MLRGLVGPGPTPEFTENVQSVAELARGGKTIFFKKAALPDADEWGKVKDKLDLLER